MCATRDIGEGEEDLKRRTALLDQKRHWPVSEKREDRVKEENVGLGFFLGLVRLTFFFPLSLSFII